MLKVPERPTEPVLFRRWAAGVLSRMKYPNRGWCTRCGRAWDSVHGHTTHYCVQQFGGTCEAPFHDGGLSMHGGCFPMCQDCWSELKPEDRLPFYRILMDHWGESCDTPTRLAIEHSVLAGG